MNEKVCINRDISDFSVKLQTVRVRIFWGGVWVGRHEQRTCSLKQRTDLPKFLTTGSDIIFKRAK